MNKLNAELNLTSTNNTEKWFLRPLLKDIFIFDPIWQNYFCLSVAIVEI